MVMFHTFLVPRDHCTGRAVGPRSGCAALVPALLWVMILTLAAAAQAQARLAQSADPPHLCEAAAHRVAASSGVPVDVLLAISHIETGRMADGRLRPWPWALNIAGRGVWAPTRDDALRQLEQALQQGFSSIDVGCFQINYRWHGHAFDSLADMMDPVSNAAYAARFLGGLHAELGDWTLAAGAYHSRTAEFAGPYAQRFASALARLRSEGSPAPMAMHASDAVSAVSIARINSYALLRPGAPVSAGSLVPAANGARGVLAADSHRRPFIAGIAP